MKLLSLLCLAISFIFACSAIKKEPEGGSSSSGLQADLVPLAGAFKVRRYHLNNNLRALLVEDHSSPTFAYQTWFRVGSRDESKGKTGLAHLFEHMMFKETENLKDGEFERLSEQEGAQGQNAFTSRDYTAYIQEMPKDKLEILARLESDRMVNLVVNENSFVTEREVVQNERRYRNENSPDGLMDQELYATAFTEHPYRWPVIGYQEDLEKMTARDALGFYRSFYSPDHSTLIVVGDIEPGEFEGLLKKYYADLKPSKTSASAPSILSEPPQFHPRRKTLSLNTQVEKLLMGYHVPQLDHEVAPVLEVLQAILSGGKSSRLNQELVETGIASSIEAYSASGKNPSLFVFEANLQNQKKAEAAEAIILKELWKLARNDIPVEELERAKNRINFSFFENLSSNYSKAYFLGYYEALAGDFTVGLKLFEKTKDVTSQDIQNAIKKYFQADQRTVIIGEPKAQGSKGQ